jgi:GNAT superfamily N-acetyltransferase
MELDRRSNEFAESIPSSFSSRQRERLISAMSEVERLMRASAVRLAVEPPDSLDARACLDAYFQEINERFDAGCDPAKTLSATPQEMSPPSGVFVIARLAGRPIGCGGLKVKGTNGDVKRMWVRPDARGLGVGRRILETLETHARGLGVGTIRLETNRNLNEAQALYRAAGYQEVDPFNEEPYAHHWFAKPLTTGPSSTARFPD